MSSSAETKVPVDRNESDPDFLQSPVPEGSRKGSLGIASVFFGFIIVAGQMAVGGSLAARMPMRPLLWAILLGNLIAGIFAAFAGVTGAHSGQSFLQLTQKTFPGRSWRAVALYVPIVLIGWYAIEAAIFGSIIAGAFGIGLLGERALAFGAALLFATSSYLGFRGLRFVSYVAVPLILLFGSYAIVRSTTGGHASYGFEPERIPFAAAFSLVVGSWIMGALTAVPDLTRFSRTLRSAGLIGFAGIVVGNSFNHLVGAAGAAFARQADPALILLGLGFVWIGIIFALANIWTTNDGNMYSASLNLGPVIGTGRKEAVIICTLLGGLAATLRPQTTSALFGFLGFLNTTAPSLGAVVLGSYWMRTRGILRSDPGPVPAWTAVLSGTAIAALSGPIWGFAVSLVFSIFVYFVMARRYSRPGLIPQ